MAVSFKSGKTRAVRTFNGAKKNTSGFSDKDDNFWSLGGFDSLTPVSSQEEEKILGAWDNIK